MFVSWRYGCFALNIQVLIQEPVPWSQRNPFFARHIWKILALVPFAFLLFVVLTCAVMVPYWDQWDMVPLLEKTCHGELTFHDLWAQHNEHRIFFPKIIMLSLARLTGWSIGCELFTILLLAIGIFLLFLRQMRMTEK